MIRFVHIISSTVHQVLQRTDNMSQNSLQGQSKADDGHGSFDVVPVMWPSVIWKQGSGLSWHHDQMIYKPTNWTSSSSWSNCVQKTVHAVLHPASGFSQFWPTYRPSSTSCYGILHPTGEQHSTTNYWNHLLLLAWSNYPQERLTQLDCHILFLALEPLWLLYHCLFHSPRICKK